MKDIRLEVSSRVYNTLLDFMKKNNIRSFGIRSRHKDGKHIITIYSDRIGIVIGKGGERIKQLENKIREDKLDANIEIVLKEMDFFIRDDNEPYSEEEENEFMNNYMMARGF